MDQDSLIDPLRRLSLQNDERIIRSRTVVSVPVPGGGAQAVSEPSVSLSVTVSTVTVEGLILSLSVLESLCRLDTGDMPAATCFSDEERSVPCPCSGECS